MAPSPWLRTASSDGPNLRPLPLDGALLLYQLIVQPWAYKAALVLSLLPFLLFFGKDCYLQGKLWVRHIRFLITTRK